MTLMQYLPSPHRYRRGSLTFGVAALLLSGCGDSTTAPASVTSVEITSQRLELVVGESHDFDAVAKSATGGTLTDRTITWTSEDEAVATIDANGILTARGGGTTGIVAASGGRSARLVITVLAPSPAPVLTALEPNRASADITTDFVVIVRGQGFTPTSRVRWNGVYRPSAFVSATELRMTVTPNELAVQGTPAVTVHTPAPGGGSSEALPFTIEQPHPRLTNVNPARIVVGWAMPFTVTLTGSGFTGATALFVDDQPRAIDARTATTISFRLLPADLRVARQITIRVSNEAPGGGDASSEFEVQAVPAASVTIDAPAGVLWTWARLRLPVSATPRSATNATLPDKILSWSVGNDAIAAVFPDLSQQAAVFGVSKGVTTVKASVDGVSAEATVKVYDTPAYDVLYSGGTPADRYVARWPIGTGAGPSRIRVGRAAMQPAPSPDGNHFAFVGFDPSNLTTELFVARVDGSDVRQITEDNASDVQPAWSPDGARLAFASSRTGVFNVFTMRLDGTDVRQLTSARIGATDDEVGQSAMQPTWSPDGSRIAYTVSFNGRTTLWVMNADGSGKRQITQEIFAHDYDPTWSPDGRTIAVRRVLMLPFMQYLARLEVSTGREQLSPLGNAISQSATPAWSPDGLWMIMGSNPATDNPVLYALPMNEFDRGARVVLPALSAGGVRDARWIRRVPAAAR